MRCRISGQRFQALQTWVTVTLGGVTHYGTAGTSLRDVSADIYCAGESAAYRNLLTKASGERISIADVSALR